MIRELLTIQHNPKIELAHALDQAESPIILASNGAGLLVDQVLAVMIL